MTFYIFVPKMLRVPLQHRLTKTCQSFVLKLKKKHKKAKCFNFIINQNCSRVESNWALIEADKRVWWYEDIKEKYEDTIKGYLIIHNHRQKVMIKE